MYFNGPSNGPPFGGFCEPRNGGCKALVVARVSGLFPLLGNGTMRPFDFQVKFGQDYFKNPLKRW